MLSKSAVETYYRCPRLYRYTYMDGVEKVQDPSKEQAFGIAGHAVLENWLAEKAEDVVWGSLGLDQLEAVKLQVLLDNDPQDFPHFRPGEVEKPFTIPELGIKGIFDAVEHQFEAFRVWEHKFTGTDFNSDWNVSYWDKLRHSDWQVGVYQLAARRLYESTAVSVLYNVYRIPALRPRKGEPLDDYAARLTEDIGERPESYYQQANIKWSDAALAILEEDIKETQAAVKTPTATFPRSRKCFEYKRKCDFYATCFEGVALTDTVYKTRTRR